MKEEERRKQLRHINTADLKEIAAGYHPAAKLLTKRGSFVEVIIHCEFLEGEYLR